MNILPFKPGNATLDISTTLSFCKGPQKTLAIGKMG